jgi:uncharacterized protein YeaC (DUF1315 family)
MDYQQMIRSMTPEIYDKLRHSVELGKWPDGAAMTREQRENAMQAIIAWGELHLDEEQRVGFIDRGAKAGDTCDEPGEVPLNWREQDSHG